MREPSVSIPFVNTALNNLYKYGNDWIYTLQVGVTAGHQFEFQELKYKNYDYLLSDMPYSSFIYGKIHEASGRITTGQFNKMIAAYEYFPFDYVIVLKATKEETIKRVSNRNTQISENQIKNQLDLQINDTSYLDDHITQFGKYFNEYIEKYFPKSKVITINVPDILTEEYNKTIKNVLMAVMNGN